MAQNEGQFVMWSRTIRHQLRIRWCGTNFKRTYKPCNV